MHFIQAQVSGITDKQESSQGNPVRCLMYRHPIILDKTQGPSVIVISKGQSVSGLESIVTAAKFAADLPVQQSPSAPKRLQHFVFVAYVMQLEHLFLSLENEPRQHPELG